MTSALLDRSSGLQGFSGRGPLSDALREIFGGARAELGALPELAQRAVGESADIARDEDIQLSLLLLYALHYGSLPWLPEDLEWSTALLAARAALEAAFEAQLRADVPQLEAPEPTADAVAQTLFALTAPGPGPSLARFVARSATDEQVQELLIQRSVYTLREADPHSWAIPRLTGRPKAALVEIQFDEYGGGDPSRTHATIYAEMMRGVGLDATYGAYLNSVPALTLASTNLMSMFGLHRRLRGAIVGHLAAFEMTSSIPSRYYADGLRRLGYGDSVTRYYDEHVEADAVHEQIAGRDLAGSLAEDEPGLLPDILFGASACLALDGGVGDQILEAWQAGRSSLREDREPGA